MGEKEKKFIVKFASEVMIKGVKAKRQMVSQIYNNLKYLLSNITSEIVIKKFYDKFEISCTSTFFIDVRQRLMETPGIELIFEVVQINNIATLDDIKIKVNEFMGKEIENKSFVVRAKRVGKHKFKSIDIEKVVGGYMLNHNKTKGVSLKNADITINIELIEKQLNIITLKYKGLGGFPIGTQGNILSLISGGFDSTVASYLTMKRGVKTHFIFFNLGGLTHEIGVKQVAYYLWNKFGASHRVSFISICFEDVIAEIFQTINPSYMGVMLKKVMLMAASKIANNMQIDAIMTGESIAQVSSQTLRNLALIEHSIDKLILRPLCTMNKFDIIDIADKIGTKKFAETMPEYCGVISKNPVIKGSYNTMKKESKKFNYSILDKAIENAKQKYVNELVEDIKVIGELEVVEEVDKNHIIIDIRQTKGCIKVDGVEVLKIPFFNLKKEFKKLPKDKEYLLYCEKGILSQLHGQYLKNCENYVNNIKVYRPKLKR